jgi:hypothetical protein
MTTADHASIRVVCALHLLRHRAKDRSTGGNPEGFAPFR